MLYNVSPFPYYPIPFLNKIKRKRKYIKEKEKIKIYKFKGFEGFKKFKRFLHAFKISVQNDSHTFPLFVQKLNEFYIKSNACYFVTSLLRYFFLHTLIYVCASF